MRERPRVFVVGGEAGPERSHPSVWTSFVAGRVVSLDLDTAEQQPLLRYVTPREDGSHEGDNVLFKSASVSGSALTLVTETEVLTLDRRSLAREARVSHPWMNDVHHALSLDDGGHLVMSTGLDLVLRLDAEGRAVARWYVGRGRLWDRFDRECDYRRVRSTQPHDAHANHLVLVRGDLWVTRFRDRDALVIPNALACAGFDELPVDLGRHSFPDGPHDGVRRGDRIWYTTVDGQLIALDEAGAIARTINLNQAYGHGEPLGWCRGLLWISEHDVLVGFSAYRHRRYGSRIDRSRARARVVLRQRAWGGPLPSERSRVVHFNVSGESPRAVREYDVEECGLRDVFSILPNHVSADGCAPSASC